MNTLTHNILGLLAYPFSSKNFLILLILFYNLYLACYRLKGEILHWGRSELAVGGIPIVLEAGEEGSFFLWAGELELPWAQPEPADEVTSPANMPEFLERMKLIWLLRHGPEQLRS